MCWCFGRAGWLARSEGLVTVRFADLDSAGNPHHAVCRGTGCWACCNLGCAWVLQGRAFSVRRAPSAMKRLGLSLSLSFARPVVGVSGRIGRATDGPNAWPACDIHEKWSGSDVASRDGRKAQFHNVRSAQSLAAARLRSRPALRRRHRRPRRSHGRTFIVRRIPRRSGFVRLRERVPCPKPRMDIRGASPDVHPSATYLHFQVARSHSHGTSTTVAHAGCALASPSTLGADLCCRPSLSFMCKTPRTSACRCFSCLAPPRGQVGILHPWGHRRLVL